VLFVGYGGGHMTMLLPVIAAMERASSQIECLLMALTLGHRKAAAVRPCVGYRDFWPLVDERVGRKWGERLLKGNESPDVPREETIAYLGINYLDLIEQLGEDGAADHYRQHGRRGFAPRGFMRRVIEYLTPDVVVATNSPRSEQAALEAGHLWGVPTLGMVDLYGLVTDPFVHRAIKPTTTCVLWPSVRDRLLSLGFDAQAVKVTGNPAFDSLFSLPVQTDSARLIEEKGWSDLHRILWAGHAEPDGREYPRRVERTLVNYVHEHPEVALAIRYHPTDWSEYPRPAAHPRIHFSETPRESLHPLLMAMNTVVVQVSTVGLEAAVAGKRVLALQDSQYAQRLHNPAQLGIATACPTVDHLPSLLDRVLAGDRSLDSQLSIPRHSSDGHAAARVAHEVLALAGVPPNHRGPSPAELA
jgi:hypothetical protein